MPPSSNYAGFWRRVVAFVIDSFLLQIALTIGMNVLAALIAFDPLNINMGKGSLLSLLFGMLYFVAMESSAKQATLGKMAIGIKVTDLQGKRITVLQAIGRHFAKILSGLILGIGFLMAAFTQKKQALHDMIAGTLVVKG